MAGPIPGSTKKNTRRAQRLFLSSDALPDADRRTGIDPMMELVLGMYSRMLAFEDCMSQHDQPQKDEAVRCSSPRLAICSVGSSQESPPREEDGYVTKMVTRK